MRPTDVPEQLPTPAVKALELGYGPALSFAARLIAQLGGDVVKVELLPDGEPLRQATPQYQARGGAAAYSAAFHFLNQGKRSVALDLDDPATETVLTRLLAWCDVALVDETFAADALIGRLVRDAESTARTLITPFGATGPYADYQSLPGAVFALGGELFMLPGGLGHRLFPDAPPLITRGHTADFDGGVIGAMVSLAALYHDSSASATNDVASMEASVSLNRWLISHYDESGWIETRDTRSYPYAGMFECTDGYAMLQPSTEHHWVNLVEMMGRPAWALKPEYATRAQRNLAGKEIAAELRQWMKAQTKQSILDGGLEYGVPAAPFRDAAEVLDCPQFGARQFFVPYGDGDEQDPEGVVPGLPFALTPFGPRSLRRAPDLGEHTAEVLEMLTEVQ